MKEAKKLSIKKILIIGVVLFLVTSVFFLKQYNKLVSIEPENGIESALNGNSDLSIYEGIPESLNITEPFDIKALQSSGLPVIIDYGADSCVPCREMAPLLAELHKSLRGRAIIRFVDVWKYKDLAKDIPLQVIPTQLLIDSNGKPFSPPESMKNEFNLFKLKETNEHVFTTHEGGLDKDQMLAILDAMGMK